MSQVICQYCNQPAKLVDSSIVYGKSYGLIYFCEPCFAWVGLKKGTRNPIGILANNKLRSLRKKAHEKLASLWKQRIMKRKEAYALAQKFLNLTSELNLAFLHNEQCELLIRKLDEYAGIKTYTQQSLPF